MTIFLTYNLFGQETKKEIIEIQSPNYSREEYFVLKDDTNVKHGEYLKYGRTGTLTEKGQFEMNIKVGIWEFYNFKNELEQRYNYTDKKIEYNKPTELKDKIWTEINGIYEEKAPDELPVFIGGQSRQFSFTLTMKYPVDARRSNTQGKVYISAIITKEGEMIDEKIYKGIGHSCNQEALRVIKNIPDEWVPGKVNGEITNVKILIPVTFKLD